MPTDDQGIPVGSEPVDATEYDFRTRRAIAGIVLDTSYGDLQRDPDGLARVELIDPARRVGVELWMDRAYFYVMLFRDSLSQIGRRREV